MLLAGCKSSPEALPSLELENIPVPITPAETKPWSVMQGESVGMSLLKWKLPASNTTNKNIYMVFIYAFDINNKIIAADDQVAKLLPGETKILFGEFDVPTFDAKKIIKVELSY